MKFTPVPDAARHETTVAIEPTPALQVDAVWQRQRFTTGRAVSAPALIEEQDHHAGRACLIAQALRPGVLQGLEASLGEADRVVVAPGVGLCADGQDVTLPRPMSITPDKLPVRMCAAVSFTGLADSGAEPALSKLLAERGRIARGGLEAAMDPDIVAALPSDTLQQLIAAVLRAEGLIKTAAITSAFTPISLSDRFTRSEALTTVDISGVSRATAVDATTRAALTRAVTEASFSTNLRAALSTATDNLSTVLSSTAESVNLSELPRFDTTSAVYQSVVASVTWSRLANSPQVCVLVLEPVEVEQVGSEGPTTDPCERDIEAEAFHDKRRVDATRAVWIPVEALFATPRAAANFLAACFTTGDDSVDRNRLAWGLFNEEDARDGAPMPWAEGGVPVALACFAHDGHLMWLDRAAVARRGGHPGDRSELLGSAGAPALWQARIEQFNEQLVGLALTPSTALSSHFRYLPPVGLLPVELVDLDDRLSPLFPERYGVSAAPIPVDELDAVVRRAAPLGPLDLGSAEGDELRLLVPVRREVWEPGLLRVEAVSPEFQATLDEAEGRRDAWLRRRAELRAKLSTLKVAIGGVSAALSFAAEEGDELAERVASEVLWDNAHAMGLLQTLAAQEAGALLSTQAALREAAGAFVGEEAAYANALGDAVFTADVDEDALAVVAGEAVELVTGPSKRYVGGWTHPMMADDLGLAVLRDAIIVAVPGTLDSDALERAMDDAAGRPLLILTSDIDEYATEQIVWIRHRGQQLVPVVVKLRGGDAAAELLREDRTALGLTKRRNLDEYYSSATTSLIVASCTGVTLVNVAGASTPAGAGVVVPQTEDDPDGPARAAFALDLLRRLRTVEESSEVDGQALLSLLGGTYAYGTYPESTGLYPVLLDELADDLDAQRTPQPGGYGSSAALTDAQLQDPNVAHNRPRVFAEGVVSLFAEVGLNGFIRQFTETARRADDLVDFSFLQVQTSTYRVREDMLGRDKAVRMASSPVLAELSDLVQADDSPQQLANFFTAVRAENVVSDTGGGGSSGSQFDSGAWYTDLTNSKGTRETELHSGITEAVSIYGDKYDTSEVMRYAEELAGERDMGALLESAASSSSSSSGSTTYTRESIASGSNVTYSSGSSISLDSGSTSSGFTRLSSGLRVGGYTGLSGASEGEAHSGGRVRAAEGEGHAFLNLRSTASLYRQSAAPIYTASIAAPVREAEVTQSLSVARMVEVARKVRTATPVGFSLRTTGIFERVQRSRAVAARQSAFRLRATATQSVYDLELFITGVRFPGFVYAALPAAVRATLDTPLDDQGAADETSTALVYAPLTDQVVAQVLKGAHDITNGDEDSGVMYSDAIRSLETTSAMLRIVEARIGEVREAVLDAQRTRALILRVISSLETALEQVEDELAEARHDVAVTQALIVEEQERVDAVNARRAQVLAQEVPFVLFHRARMAVTHDALPVHDLEPVFDQRQAIRAALQPAPPAPEELRDMVELLRELPVRQLRSLRPYLRQLDRLDALRRTMELAQVRALRSLQVMPAALGVSLASLRGRQAVQAMVSLRQRQVISRRSVASGFQLAKLQAVTWQQAQVHASEVLSVGDLIDSRWVSSDISGRGTQELESIYRVAAHLYAELALVTPELRSLWSRRLSEHDRPMDLSELSVLPRWSEVGEGSDTAAPDPFRKRELQLMVSWLHGRVDSSEEDAVELINDLVRVCILLASHAPVGQILSGHVDEPTPIAIGARVPVRIDPSRLRVGMAALLTIAGRVRARAVVEDLGQGRVFTRVVTSDSVGVTLDKGAQVRFMEADGVTFPSGSAKVLSAVGPRLLS
ncbi:MAG: hypothetical protein H6740_07400 [Alphaproteobacteria bacterium]|nr:hypothetical protein [Alphaproteobacteria bacterium]